MADIKRTHITISAPLLEMESASDLASLVKVDSELIREITEGDDEPKYVIVDIEEQKSGNNINYDWDAFTLIADQVNSKQPTGYLGHKHFQGLDKEDLLPDPQVLWLGANVSRNSNGKARLVTKGYLIPEGKARGWIKRKVVNSVSWAGDAILVPAKEGGYNLKEYILESIDFSRKNKEGLRGQRLTVVTEEIGDPIIGGNKVTEDEIRSLQLSELQTHNPGLVKTIKEMQAAEDETKTTEAVAAKEKELTDAHKVEMEAVPEISLMQKIKALLGIGDDGDPVESLTELISKLDNAAKDAVRSWFDTEILAKKVPSEQARKLIGRLIPVTEMEGDWRSEKGIEKIKVSLEERVDDAMENDDDIKAILTEMGSSRGGLRLNNGSGGTAEDKGGSGGGSGEGRFKDAERRGNLKLEEVEVGR